MKRVLSNLSAVVRLKQLLDEQRAGSVCSDDVHFVGELNDDLPSSHATFADLVERREVPTEILRVLRIELKLGRVGGG